MTATVADVQAKLKSLGIDPGPVDDVMGDRTRAALRTYQKGVGTPVTGAPDTSTLRSLFPLTDPPVKVGTAAPAPPVPSFAPGTAATPVTGLRLSSMLVPAEWMPAAKMARIIVHWSAGPHKATALDRQHYHIIVQGDGTLVRGNHSIKDNEAPKSGNYAAHTLNCNTGSIGVSLACMAGAVESPFDAGSAPMTRDQWDALPLVLADLCQRYGIPVGPKTVLSHAEVQGTLGIKQRGKWDISRLAFDPTVKGATACGDLFRAATANALASRGVSAHRG